MDGLNWPLYSIYTWPTCLHLFLRSDLTFAETLAAINAPILNRSDFNFLNNYGEKLLEANSAECEWMNHTLDYGNSPAGHKLTIQTIVSLSENPF